MKLRAGLILWHPESPGVRVRVYRWFPTFRLGTFATVAEVLRERRRIPIEDRTRP